MYVGDVVHLFISIVPCFKSNKTNNSKNNNFKSYNLKVLVSLALSKAEFPWPPALYIFLPDHLEHGLILSLTVFLSFWTPQTVTLPSLIGRKQSDARACCLIVNTLMLGLLDHLSVCFVLRWVIQPSPWTFWFYNYTNIYLSCVCSPTNISHMNTFWWNCNFVRVNVFYIDYRTKYVNIYKTFSLEPMLLESFSLEPMLLEPLLLEPMLLEPMLFYGYDII